MGSVRNIPHDLFQPQPDPARLLSFRVGGRGYALPLALVREVVAYEAPGLAALPAGVHEELIHLRRAVLPVLHLRVRFGLPLAEAPATGFIIILRFGARHVGLVVDSVEQTLDAGAPAGEEPLGLLDLEEVVPAVYLYGAPAADPAAAAEPAPLS